MKVKIFLNISRALKSITWLHVLFNNMHIPKEFHQCSKGLPGARKSMNAAGTEND